MDLGMMIEQYVWAEFKKRREVCYMSLPFDLAAAFNIKVEEKAVCDKTWQLAEAGRISVLYDHGSTGYRLRPPQVRLDTGPSVKYIFLAGVAGERRRRRPTARMNCMGLVRKIFSLFCIENIPSPTHVGSIVSVSIQPFKTG